ncbi:Crp/Fnr family transcriptional regulator [Magnetospirillum sulfuroxidans]|uniref:Crp/Fnr family transcriptional regulator n=1 Tax=Magnetospirillum sulfuroxidans TaxID=611300 RepID=A0ABS5IG64_9PROT|nr:Crp/Fnr family transcriptional regulator [Magnetospirillum sulfuroxidans]MBR9972743.1 Crp/Fnr family transcriptional regulator [Magnetospirillum sulfuroxidans]
MAADYSKLLEGIRPNRLMLAAGDVVMRAGDKVAAIYAVETGRVALSRHGSVVHVADPGTLFGESGLFGETNPVDAVAMGPAVVLAYAQAQVLLHLRAHPDLNLAFSAYLARRLNAARARIELGKLRGAQDRVVAFLTQAGAAEGWIKLGQPLSHIAADIGLTHEAFYRTLRKLVDAGLLERQGRRGFWLKGDHA